ncbi:hypothetical protein [Catellatospora citrea]|uniref:Uncharacterized protein n=1 Tax=Catellatospora citrea TaxID=53366 RepID=A0A8J3KPD4_9ACTN|nr:hypothetical protein [Catellatospora citrea]RKE10822.1 hypothetical protein C8E86_5741 [Catellatospora citrea]GIG00939.1 hypothetical protein Cci01nite_60320 [Catellatospora citrea]
MQLDDMRKALRTAIETDEPPIADGPAAVFTTARRIRTRQRLVTVAAGVATLGLLAGVVSVLGLGRTDDVQPAVPVPQVAPASASPSPSPSTAGGCPCPTGAPAAAKVLAALKALLPTGSAVSQPASQDGFAEVVITDRLGRTLVMVNVQPAFIQEGKPGAGDMRGLLTCGGRSLQRGTTCTERVLDDGTRMVVTEGPETTGHDRIVQRTVDILRPDGVRVAVTAYNAVKPKGNTPTRKVPVLTLAQLEAMATSPRWPV